MGCAVLYQTKQSNINSNMLEILDKLAKLAKLIYWQIDLLADSLDFSPINCLSLMILHKITFAGL